jgi:transposase
LAMEEKVGIVLLRLGKQWPVSRVARVMRCGTATVKRVVVAWNNGSLLAEHHPSGRPSALTPELEQQLVRIITENSNATSKRLAAIINETRETPLPNRTVRAYRRRLGFHPVHARRQPLLTDRHRQLRLGFCRAHAEDNVKRWVFSDEVGVEVGGDGNIYWIRRGDARPVEHRTSHPVRVNFWAFIGWDIWSAPAFYDGTCNQSVYLRLLRTHVQPQLPWGNRVLLQDGAGWHRTRSVREWLENHEVADMRDFPPCSPDLNAIESVWGWMKRRVAASGAQTADDLKRAIRDAWRELPLDTMRGYIEHVSNVMRQIVANGGGNSKS